MDPHRLGGGAQQPADLRAEHVLVAGSSRERPTQPSLGQPVAVERGRVEVADARVPGRVDHRGGAVVVDRGVEVAERRASQPEATDLGPAASQSASAEAHRSGGVDHAAPPTAGTSERSAFTPTRCRSDR